MDFTVIRDMIAGFIRTIAAPLVFVLTPYISESEATQFVATGVTLAIAVLWSLINKVLFDKEIDKAIVAPPTVTREELEKK